MAAEGKLVKLAKACLPPTASRTAVRSGALTTVTLAIQVAAHSGGFARACRLADSHGPLTVSPSGTVVDHRVRIGQDSGAVSAVVTGRSRTVLMERCRPIVKISRR
jgi:hypothetical protein